MTLTCKQLTLCNPIFRMYQREKDQLSRLDEPCRIIPKIWGSPIRIAITMHWCACMSLDSDRYINPPPVMFELHYPHKSVAWVSIDQNIEAGKSVTKIEVPTGSGLKIGFKLVFRSLYGYINFLKMNIHENCYAKV